MEQNLVEDVPVGAVIVHGNGEPSYLEFQSIVSAHAIGKMFSLLHFAEKLYANSQLIAQSLLLTEWLSEQTATFIRRVCSEPSLLTWISDIEQHIKQGKTSLVDVDLGKLPYVFLGYLSDVSEACKEYKMVLPTTGRIAPVFQKINICGSHIKDNWATLSTSGSSFRIQCKHGIANADVENGSVKIANLAGLETRERLHLFSDVELHTVTEFPEFQRLAAEDQLDVDVEEADRLITSAYCFIGQIWSDALIDLITNFRGLIPICSPVNHTYSSSNPLTPSIIQLTLQSEMPYWILAECIVHETAHIKLGHLQNIDPLLENDNVPRYKHPWRPELRPLIGVLYGAHAFANVTKMYERAVMHFPSLSLLETEFLRCRSDVHQALQILDNHASFTETGKKLFSGMCQTVAFQSAK